MNPYTELTGTLRKRRFWYDCSIHVESPCHISWLPASPGKFGRQDMDPILALLHTHDFVSYQEKGPRHSGSPLFFGRFRASSANSVVKLFVRSSRVEATPNPKPLNPRNLSPKNPRALKPESVLCAQLQSHRDGLDWTADTRNSKHVTIRNH